MVFDAGQHFWLVGYSFHFFVGVANIFWSWSFDCGWGTLSGLRSTLLAGLLGLVWCVGCGLLVNCIVVVCIFIFV